MPDHDYGPNRSAPYSAEAEQAVLGSVLLTAGDILPELDLIATDFYLHKHRWIWDAFQALRADHQPIDLLTASDALTRANRLEEVGGAAYLTQLINGTPTSIHAQAYAALVRKEAERRGLIELATDIAKSAYDRQLDLDLYRAEVMTKLVKQIRVEGGATPMREHVERLYDALKEAADNPQSIFGMPTGFKDIDERLAGVHEGEALLLGGEPGTGKSLLMMQVALNLGRAGFPGAIYEMEMGALQITRRNLSGLSGIPSKKLRSGIGLDNDWPMIIQICNEMAALPVYLSDATHWTTASLRADLARLKAAYGIRWFVIDYLGLLKDRVGADDNERDRFVSTAVKDLCKDLDLAGLFIHSMNKVGMGAGRKRLEHISGSGRFVFDADVVLFIQQHIPMEGEREDRNLRTITFEKFREDDPNHYVHLVKRPGLPAFGDYKRDEPANTRASIQADMAAAQRRREKAGAKL